MSPDGISRSQSCVLDASALLALLRSEPGGELVESLLSTSAISSVNWSEVIQKGLERKAEIDGLREDLESLGLEIIPFTTELAEGTARLRETTRSAGLSLADRACIALAQNLGRPAVTTDKVWSELPLGVEILVVR